MSTLKTISIVHPSGSTTNITNDSSGNMTVGGTLAMSSSFAFRNKVINGDMRIDQRNSGASITLASGITVYAVDRMDAIATGASKFSVQRNAGSVTPPAGFINYFGATSLAATTVGSTDLYRFGTTIEGNMIADFAWGTASAKTVTLSFYVYSSLTGNFSVCLQNAANTRAYPILFNIPSANTWTRITIVIPGETSGAWNTDTNMGVRIQFGLGLGSTKTTTSGSWANGDYNGATGLVNVVSTNGATFYVTGLQLEVGSIATSFEFRPIGTELALCQRYLPAISYAGGTNPYFGAGMASSTSAAYYTVSFPVTPRVPPTGLTVSAAAHFAGFLASTATSNATVVNFGGADNHSAFIQLTGMAGLVAGNATLIYMSNSAALMLFTGCEL
jgi:hypothetical protein